MLQLLVPHVRQPYWLTERVCQRQHSIWYQSVEWDRKSRQFLAACQSTHSDSKPIPGMLFKTTSGTLWYIRGKSRVNWLGLLRYYWDLLYGINWPLLKALFSCDFLFGSHNVRIKSLLVILFSKIVIEGIRGQSYAGDIAVDDFWIDDSPCPPEGCSSFFSKYIL